TFQTLVNPGTEIPPFITILTGITHAMVIEAPRIEEALASFLEFIGDAVIVGHNVRFDLSFLNAAAMRLGYGKLPNRHLDTLALARRLVRNEVRNLKLASLAAHFRSPTTPNHRAFEDAKATAHVFHALLERSGTVGVTALEDLLQLPTARGSAHYGKIRMAEHLPRRPGVYLFKDRRDEIIYVGKAKNLRTRVRSYFYGDQRRSITNLLNELQAIEHRVCETELEASITELRLIHAHRPRYNRASKPPKSSHWVKLTDEAFPRFSLVRSLREDGLLYLGPFRSRKAAEVVMTAIWDAAPIRRCMTKPGSRKATCAFDQLGVARCPCDGSMTETEYGEVVAKLLYAVKSDPAMLLDPLRMRMIELATSQRYEEAAWMRDRYRSLARSLERRAGWQAMVRAGRVWAEDSNGDSAVIDRGRLVAAWKAPNRPFMPPEVGADEQTDVPPSVEVAEEARLLWSWLASDTVRVVEASGEVAAPAPIPELAA
ncbi:MAG: DEDD exonuclease domain-containing protein, partial [Acidimicrobiia bacterium]|nr:DEDD exonuclease domain-containing protein [Acidimicrobiia bacterium]